MSEAKKLFLTDKCCCIFSLETGGYIIGCLGTFVGSVMAIYYYTLIRDFWGASCDDFQKDNFFEKFFSMFDNCETVKTVSMAYIIFFLIMILLDIVVTILFMVGIKKRCHKLILPVIVAEFVGFGFFLIKQLIKFNKLAFAITIGFGALSIYFIIIMSSLYFKFKSERKESPRYSPAE